MSATNNKLTTSVCAHLVKLYKILVRLALGPIVSEIMKNKFVFPSFWINKNLFELVYIFHRSWINFSIRWKQRRMTPGFCRGQILLMESAPIWTKRMFLQTVMLPFSINATIPTDTLTCCVLKINLLPLDKIIITNIHLISLTYDTVHREIRMSTT